MRLKSSNILQFLLIIVAFFFKASYAVEIENWSINQWGNIKPAASLEKNSNLCSRDSKKSTLFQVVSRGSGDVELISQGLLKQGEAYRFTGWMKSSAPISVQLFFRKDAFPYDTSVTKTVQVFGWTFVDMIGIYTSTGSGSIRIGLSSNNVSLCLSESSVSQIKSFEVGQAPGAKVDEKYFGIHLNKLGEHNSWPDFNPGSIRLWDSGTTWANLQPINSNIDWQYNQHAKRLDYYINHGLKNNPSLRFIYTLAMTPNWNGSRQSDQCHHSPYGESSCTMPVKLESWRNFVREVAIKYNGIINIWELWNEADIPMHWSQTPEDLVLLAKIANEELKAINSKNKLIGPSITSGGFQFLRAFLNASGGAYVDGVSFHGYLGNSPSLAISQIRNLRQILKEAGQERLDIWNTETSLLCNSFIEVCSLKFNEKNRSDETLAKGLLGNAALGVKVFEYYTWEGVASSEDKLGLVNSDFKTSNHLGKVVKKIKSWIVNGVIKYEKSNFQGLNIISVERNSVKSYVMWTDLSSVNINLSDWMKNPNIFKMNDDFPTTPMSGSLIIDSAPVLIFENNSLK